MGITCSWGKKDIIPGSMNHSLLPPFLALLINIPPPRNIFGLLKELDLLGNQWFMHYFGMPYFVQPASVRRVEEDY